MINIHFAQPDETGKLAQRDVAYMLNPQQFIPYITALPTIENIAGQALFTGISQEHRTWLKEELLLQTNGYPDALLQTIQPVMESIEHPNTYTVITAHQPVLFSGPMYVFFKALSAIAVARKAEAAMADCRVIPVLVLGQEDHDFEEVNHLHLWGQRITWEHANPSGPAGMLSLDGIERVISEIRDVVGHTPHGPALTALMEEACSATTDYGSMIRYFLQKLFAETGLLVVHLSPAAMKQRFVDIMMDDILLGTSLNKVTSTIEGIKAGLGFEAQAPPRRVNLFYAEPGMRLRIDYHQGKYIAGDGRFSWSREELANEIKESPEKFSPNVILRPLYQEMLFPNLAYVGGGGEIAYWLERKAQFDHYGVPFPVLVRRDSAFMLDKPVLRRIEKLKLSIADLWKDKHQLIREHLESASEHELALTEARKSIAGVFEQIRNRAVDIDPTLERPVLAEMTRTLNSIENLEKKMVRSEKKNQELLVQQIEYFHDRLFPANSIQERHESFLSFYSMYGPGILETLAGLFDPMDSRIKIIEL